MATWVRGVDFKNSTNTKRIGGIGIYGTDATTNKLYIGLGAEPWNNAGLQLTSSAINFKGNKIYHAGDKPTLSELGAAASSHTHSYLPLSGGTLTGETVFNNYLSLNAWSGYGSGKAQLWYNGTNKQLVIQPTAVTDIIVNNNKVYHAGNKPTPAEIGAAASSHTHNYAGSSSAGGAATTALTSNYLGSNTRMEYGWNGVNYFNISGTAGNAAKANDTPSTAWWHIMRFNHANSTGYYTDLAIPFNDTSLHYKRITAGSVQNGGWVKILDSLNYNSYAPTKTGTGASGTWGISITGNANTATTLANARTINGTSFNGSTNITTANWGTARTITIGSTGKSVNGSANVSWSLSEIGAAAASHSHSYLPLSGGTLTGRLTANGKISLPTTGSSWLSGKTLTNASIAITTKQTTESYHPVLAVQSSSNHVVNIGGLGDNFGFYGYKSTRTDNGTDWSFTFNASNGAVSSSGNITAPVFAGNLQGNATTATTLQNARTINGTSFNGSANITTANWGTARTITIGSTGKSVNGSANVSWSLSEIGAAAASHSHSYLPLSGGTMTGTISSSLSTATHLAGNQGKAIINSTASGSGYNMLAKMNSTNGAWTMGGWGDTFNLFYTANSTVTAGTNSYTKRLTLLNESGNSSFPGTVSASSFSGALSGNASTATTLQNARTINGTSFNGSANITTANWGTARTLTIGSTGKSVNGSGNVSWSLAEIGAAAASHTHSNYVSTSGGQQINGDLNFTKKLRLYENSAISFMLDAGQTYLESGTLYSDKNGGVTFLTGRGIETSLNNNAYFEGINGFTKSFEILTSTSPSITLTPLTNPTDNTGGRIIFKSPDNQNVQLRHEWYDGSLMPFGLVLEKASGNAQAFNACLKVQGAVICGVNDAFIDNTNKPDARIVRGSTDNAGGLKIQMGGTNTTASFEVVNPNWSAAWFSCGNTGIRSNSYSNFSDEKLKTNIEEVNYSVSDKINKIKIYNYNYLSDYNRVIPSIIKRDIKCKTTAITRLTKTDNYKISLSSKTNELYEDVPEKRWGVIAQEVEELFPELITETEELIDGEKKLVKSVDVYGLTVLTLEFAKELKAEIQSMKEKLGLE